MKEDHVPSYVGSLLVLGLAVLGLVGYAVANLLAGREAGGFFGGALVPLLGAGIFAFAAALTPAKGGPLPRLAVACLLVGGISAGPFAGVNNPLTAAIAGAALSLAGNVLSAFARSLFGLTAPDPHGTARWTMIGIVVVYAAMAGLGGYAGTITLAALAIALWRVIPATTNQMSKLARAVRRLFLPAEGAPAKPKPTAATGLTQYQDYLRGMIIDYYSSVIKEWSSADQWSTPVIAEVFDAPGYTTYVLLKPPTISLSALTSRADELATHLKRRAEDVAVTQANERGGVYIQISKPKSELPGVTLEERDRRSIVWVDELLGDPKVQRVFANENTFDVVVGRDSFGEPAVLDISGLSDEKPHVLIAGSSGGGKSSTLHTILTQLVTRHGPDEVQIAMIDMKKEATYYRHLPHMYPSSHNPATSPEDARILMEEIDRERESRAVLRQTLEPMPVNLAKLNKNFPEYRRPFLFLVIDEASDYGANGSVPEIVRKAYTTHVGAIARKGRSEGVLLIVATQRPSVRNVGEDVRGQLQKRIVHVIEDPNEATMAFGEEDKEGLAKRLGGKGDGYLSVGGVKTRFTAAYTPTDEEPGHPGLSVSAFISEAIEKYGRREQVAPITPPQQPGSPESVRRLHNPEVNDREWLVVEGLLSRTGRAEDEYEPVETSPEEIAALAERRGDELGYRGPAIGGDDVARALGRFYPEDRRFYTEGKLFAISYIAVEELARRYGVAASEETSDGSTGGGGTGSGGSDGGSGSGGGGTGSASTRSSRLERIADLPPA